MCDLLINFSLGSHITIHPILSELVREVSLSAQTAPAFPKSNTAFYISMNLERSIELTLPVPWNSVAVNSLLQDPPEQLMKVLRAKKIDVGLPTRVLLKPGDAFIVHQRLANTQGINLTSRAAKFVTFKIAHTDYDELLDGFLDSKLPFTGFEPLQDIVVDEFDN